LQFLIIIAGSVTLAYFSFASIQLIDDFQAGLPPESFSLIRSLDDRAVPWPGLITGIPILCAYFWFANQNMLQWGLSAKSLRDAQFGLIFTGFLKLSVFFILVVPGVFAAVLFPGIDEPDRVYLILLTELLPAGALGLAMTGLVAALLSNTDSSLHAATTIFTLDLVRRRQPNLDDKQLIFISRAFTLVIMIISAFWAREIDKFDTLFEYVQSTLSYSITPLVTVYVGGIFYKRFTSNAAFYSLLIGISGSLSLVILKNYIPLFDFHYLYVPLPICLLCLISMFVITYFDTSYSERDDKLDKNLTWSVKEHSVLEILKDRQLYISSALLLVCTFLFVIYFA
jgi:SSS family solute:Na+ symporter